jgi:hypothetical protein
MKRFRAWAVVALATLGTSMGAQAHAAGAFEESSDPQLADEAPESARSTQRARRGTYFIGELRLGSTVGGAGELAYGGALGVGGRWHGLPPIYLIGALDHTSAVRGGAAANGFALDESLSLTAIGTGLRLYLPVTGPLRLMGEISFGALAVEARARDEAGAWVEALWLPYTELGFGPQFRMAHHVSIGARAAVAFVDTSALHPGGPTAAWEPDLRRRSSLFGSVTLHF